MRNSAVARTVVAVLALAGSGVAAFALAKASVHNYPLAASYDGGSFNAGADQYLTVVRDAGPGTFTSANGVIKNTGNSYSWGTYALDSGSHVGLIEFADPPRWEVTLEALQPVRVYGDGTTDWWSYPSYYYRAEAQHIGFARLFGETLVWDGAHYHIGNAESDDDSFWHYEVNDGEELTLWRKVRSSGELSNASWNDDGTRAKHVESRTVNAAGIYVDNFSYTLLAQLTHRPYDVFQVPFRHHVELDVNHEPGLADAGQFTGFAEAWDDGTGKRLDRFPLS